MDNNSHVTGLRALVVNVMLERARELSDLQAFGVWRMMQRIDAGGSLKSVPPATLQMAMDFDRFPIARRVIEEKALAHERAIGKAGNVD